MSDKSDIRDAATVILVRDPQVAPRILVGQRGKHAVFMPSKFVFPGGAVDGDDRHVELASPLDDLCQRRLASAGSSALPGTMAAAAIRELWEETGLILGTHGSWSDTPPTSWQSFADRGFRPDASALSFIFRAVTPPGAPRRFDARFFLADAAHVAGDLDDFSAASDELSQLQWVSVADLRHYDLPFITEVVLAEVDALLPRLGPPADVPFFSSVENERFFSRLT